MAMEDDSSAESAQPAHPSASGRRLLTARSEYLEALDSLFAVVQTELRVVDADAADLGLDRATRIDELTLFLRRSRSSRLLIAVRSVDHLERHCPRLIDLLRHASDRISIHKTEGEAARAEDCFVLADDLHVLRRPVQAQARGVLLLDDRREAALMRERFEQIWERSVSALSATTLGL